MSRAMGTHQWKRTVGVALLASAGVLVVVAVLLWARVVPVGDGAREIAAGAILLAALADLFIGLRFLQETP